MRARIVLFVLLVFLAACNQETNLQVPVAPLGEVEVSFTESAAVSLQGSLVGALSFELLSQGVVDQGGMRYLHNTYRFLNHSEQLLSNLTFYALSRTDTIGGTAITRLQDAAGNPINNASIARSIHPTHRMEDSGVVSVKPDEADFQAFRPSEAAALQSQLAGGRSVLEYGYVARSEHGGRAIAPGEAGIVSFAVKFPYSPTAAQPFSFTLILAATDEPITRVTRSPEGDPVSAEAVCARAATIGATEVIVIGDLDPLNVPPDCTLERLEHVKVAASTAVLPEAYLLAGNFTEITWTTVTAAPRSLTEAQGEVVDGKLYLFGGYTSFSPLTISDKVYVYDPITNLWTALPDSDMPVALTHAGTAVDGRDIYFAGGYPAREGGGQNFATSDVWRFNVDEGSWTAMPPLPLERGAGALARLGRNLHFFGGVDAGRADRGDHWILSLDGGSEWTPAAPLPNPRSHVGATVLDGRIYAIGGVHGFDHHSVSQTSVHMWDPISPDTWTEVADFPVPVSHISASTLTIGNRIVVLGGERAHIVGLADVRAYDPRINAWESLPSLPCPRIAGVAGYTGSEIVFTTGSLQNTTFKGVPVYE